MTDKSAVRRPRPHAADDDGRGRTKSSRRTRPRAAAQAVRLVPRGGSVRSIFSTCGPAARLGAAMALALAAVAAYFVVPSPKDLPGWMLLCLCGLGLLLLTTLMSRLVLQHFFAPVDSEVRVELLPTAILVSVLLFGIAYHTVAVGRPGQFVGLQTRLDALYFSLSTLTTAGSGNIRPAGQLARAFVVGQLVFDTAIVTTALSAFSGRLRARKRRRAAAGQP
jgi:voltage-gated potassium channel